MTLFCVHKYFKNESVVSVSYRRFHDTPDDVYPSISICFSNKKSGPFVDTNGIDRNHIARMMNGKAIYNESLLNNIKYEDMTIGLPVQKIEYLTIQEDPAFTEPCVDSKCFNTYGDGKIKCFIHDINFLQGEMYKHLTILLKKTRHMKDKY